MASSHPLERAFYDRPTLTVAQELIGARLVRLDNGVRISGYITETEAYIGLDDLGSHAHRGKTRRNAVMFGQPGHAYVYFTYGQHWCLNAVTEAENTPAAVLIRAIEPVEGLEIITTRRSGRDTYGPAKLTQALGITGELNGADLCDPESSLWIEPGVPIAPAAIVAGPRIGLYTVPEPWKSIPWNFRIDPQALNQ